MSGPGKQLSEFLAEGMEIVDSLGKGLLRLDESAEDPDPDLVNSVFRAAHSLKGLAGMFGVEGIAGLAHTVEDLLDGMRLGRVRPSPDVLDVLLEAVELFSQMLAELEAGRDGTGPGGSRERTSALSTRIATAVGGGAAPKTEDLLDEVELDPSVRGVLTEYEEHRLRENVRKGLNLYRVRAGFELATFDIGLAQLNGQLKPLGEVVSTLPSSEPGDAGIAFDLIVAAAHQQGRLEAALVGLPASVAPIGRRGAKARGAGKRQPRRAAQAASRPEPEVVQAAAPELLAQPQHRAQPEPEPEDEPLPPPRAEERRPRQRARPEEPARERPGAEDEPEEQGPSLRSVSQTVRVDIGKLDRLMNVVGELVLVKTNLQRLAEAVKAARADPQLAAELQREGRNLERKLDQLQDGILEVRMVPLGQVFDKLARLVRKIARDAGKEIDLRVQGGDVELDKLIVEDLSDPLMHLIRNSIDHGIELADDRQAAGKGRRGTLTLTATQKGNHVILEVGDDGAGIDEERVREVAVERGLLSRDAARDLSRRDLLNVIFQPGFTTTRFVSELSGRGVGLDVVKTNIANLSGLIDVRSERGAGTTFALTLPVTLAIIRALVVGVEGRTFAVPLNSVLEILSVTQGEVRTIERREVVSVRGSTLRLVRLGRLFRFPPPARPAKRMYVVVVGLAQERLGIAVDELVGQQDIVIKSLGRQLGAVRGIAGATDLGNQRTVLVLDVGAIIEEVLEGGRLLEVG